MKLPNALILSAIALFSTQCDSHAQQQPIIFDFEPNYTIATHPNALSVGPSTLYEPEQRFGWAHGISIDRAHDRDTPDSPYYYMRKQDPRYDLIQDGVTVIGPNTFTAQVPNGTYRVTMYVGDFGPSESRDHLFATFNGVPILTDESTAGGQAKAFSFTTQITTGKIVLEVEGKGHQRYLPLNGLILEPTTNLNQPPTVQLLPEKTGTPQTYAEGWKQFIIALQEDWNKAKAQLQQEGQWSDQWPTQRRALQEAKTYREVFASGAVRFDDLSRRAGGSLEMQEFAAVIREIGLDGLITNYKSVYPGLTAGGIKVAQGAPGYEGLTPGALPTEAFNTILDRNTGQLSPLDQAYTPFSPLARDFFRQKYSEQFLPLAPESQFMMVDEIRGAFAAGHLLGDYSESARLAFLAWAKEQGIKLTSTALPRPGRTWDFYHFYRFRMGAVPRFTKSFMAGTAFENHPIYLGNGFLGPEYANHNSLWPPDAIEAGYGLASWDYDGNKASAEFLAAMEREHNGKVQSWTALWRTPEKDLVDAAVVAGVATREFSIWHQGTFIQSGNRVPWMKSAYLATRLAQALGNATHHTNVYIYAPDSLVFNDLVGDLPVGEFSRWKEIATQLGEGNIDFKVTHTLQVPQGSLVIYAPQRAVLRLDEAQTLTDYIANGGQLLYASESQPETPDAQPLVELQQALNGKNVTRAARPEAAIVRNLATAHNVAINPASETPAIRSFAYQRGGKQYVLHVNTDLEKPATGKVEGNYRDYFSGERISSTLQIAKANYRFLEKTE